jgi:uncharacterized protein YggL (DUF469 family)
MESYEILCDGPIRHVEFHGWMNSSACKKYVDKLDYRGWFDNFMELLVETNRIIFKIGKKINKYEGFICKARVSKCGEICQREE